MPKVGILLSYLALALGAFTAGVLGSQIILTKDLQSITPAATRSTLAAAAASDWTILSPKLAWAVDKARLAAQKRARADLDVWRERVMQRVEPAFLDWHFGYFNKRYEDLKWIWRRITESGEDADRKYLEAVADAIAEKVLPPTQVESEIALIAKGAAQEFIDELVAIVKEYRREMAEHADLLDARLQAVHVTLVGADQRPVLVSLNDLSTHSHEENRALPLLQLQLIRNVKSAEPVVRADLAAQNIAGVAAAAAKAGTAASGAAKALGASKAVVATVGTAAAAVVVIAAVGGHEWWMHSEYVREQRPQLRAQIEASLRDFTHALLQGDGRLGAELEALASQLTRAIRQQETAWGRFRARLTQHLRL